MPDPISYTTYNQAGANQGVSGTNQTQYNVYNPNQQGLQNQLGGLYSNFLSGQVPSAFTSPDALLGAYNQNFNNNTAHVLASQFGAGSPQIAGQYNQGLINLLAGQYNQGFNNYQNALNSSANFAFNPIGQVGNQGTQFQNQSATQGSQTQTYPLSLLYELLGGPPSF